jgi:UDP-glucose 4-epimerase
MCHVEAAMRVLITGMGGELGTRVAQLLEAEQSVQAICGVDIDPPRHRLRRADFHRVDPRLRHRTVEMVRNFEPTVVAHLGVFEPDARSGPRLASALTASGAVGLFGAIDALSSVESVVVRSGIEVYGRHRGAPVCPDESSPTDPSSAFGHALRHVEQMAVDAAERLGVPVALLRMAPVVGPHFPSPLGRLLRLPAVPFSVLGDPPFSVVHQTDAAAAVVAAVLGGVDGTVNVVAPGAVTVTQAARMGRRVPVPVVGPGWRAARLAAEMAGAPVPDHVVELLVRGRSADGSSATGALSVSPQRPTADVVDHLYDWPDVTTIRPVQAAA